METIICTVHKAVYTKPGTDYRLVKCRDNDHKRDFIAVGSFPSLMEGMALSLEGDWVTHPQYGRQFKTTRHTEVEPTSLESFEQYLSKGPIFGIGPKIAHALVKQFGEKTQWVIENNPTLLLKVPGLGKAKARQLAEEWNKHSHNRKEQELLIGEIGLSQAMAKKIIEKYGEKTVEAIKTNPYRLIDDMVGVGFIRADEVALKLGIEPSSPFRISAGILYALKEAEGSHGDAFLYRDQLIKNTLSLLKLEEASTPNIEAELDKKTMTWVIDGERIYINSLYQAETEIATHLHAILDEPFVLGSGINKGTKVVLSYSFEGASISYSEQQQEAIRMALQSKILIITGGPGTGKTTVVKGILAAMKANGLYVQMAAPTGKAAKRMEESTGYPAKTIHRLLESNQTGKFSRNADNPIDGDVLILDECSMIDLRLMHSLLDAVPSRMKIIFVGDVDQLPSIGAGCVLRDLIDCGTMPVVRLTQIFRQAAQSSIITNAHRVNNGYTPYLSNTSKDFFFISKDRTDVPNEILSLVSGRLQNYTEEESYDIQVLTPMRKGPSGCDALNGLIQSQLNPSDGNDVKCGNTVYRKNDRVMQIKNNYKKGVFNGDVGVVTLANPKENMLVVKFGSTSVEYREDDIKELDLAYATTIHKSQGSEYPVVVIPITSEHYVMLQRNLLYTALTRAKKLCVLVGDDRQIAYAVRNNPAINRNTYLKERLKFQ
ncbi:MAG: ATP-dependent RecD-like DNA helicase [Bacteroidales bacterium]|nr:ATP-dependent RecD-like DNA helicase [Bacteroidales bacterium]